MRQCFILGHSRKLRNSSRSFCHPEKIKRCRTGGKDKTGTLNLDGTVSGGKTDLKQRENGGEEG
jgi:hypothetical protein